MAARTTRTTRSFATWGWREIVTLAPLLVFVFWIGLHPEPFTRVMHASVANVIRQAGSPGRSALLAAKDEGGKKLALAPLAAPASLPETKP